MKYVSTGVRANVGTVMIFHQPNHEIIRSLHELCPMTRTAKEFADYLEEHVHSYCYLAYNAKEISNDFDSKFQLQKASSKIPEFTIGE